MISDNDGFLYWSCPIALYSLGSSFIHNQPIPGPEAVMHDSTSYTAWVLAMGLFPPDPNAAVLKTIEANAAMASTRNIFSKLSLVVKTFHILY
jgi:hypothetical protein